MTRPASIDLGPITRIPVGEGRTFHFDWMAITVFRTREGKVFATQAHCPHRGGPLADGLVGGGRVICPLHAFKFDLATGRAVDNDCEPLATYPITVVAGRLLLEPAFSPATCSEVKAE